MREQFTENMERYQRVMERRERVKEAKKVSHMCKLGWNGGKRRKREGRNKRVATSSAFGHINDQNSGSFDFLEQLVGKWKIFFFFVFFELS